MALALLYPINTALIVLINLRWKISVHMTSLAGFVSILLFVSATVWRALPPPAEAVLTVVTVAPLLVLLLHFNQRLGAGTSLAAIIPTATVGVISYAVHDSVAWVPALILAAGSVVGAQIGTRLLPKSRAVRLQLPLRTLADLDNATEAVSGALAEGAIVLDEVAVLTGLIETRRRLLETTDLPVETVAARSGFGSALVLRNHFRRITGTTPLGYRRTFRGARAAASA